MFGRKNGRDFVCNINVAIWEEEEEKVVEEESMSLSHRDKKKIMQIAALYDDTVLGLPCFTKNY